MKKATAKAASKKAPAKAAATEAPAPAASPTQTVDTPPPVVETEPSASALMCSRSFRAADRLFERGKRYDDVPKDIAKRFAHRFVDPRADL